MWARTDLGKNDIIATHEEFHTENSPTRWAFAVFHGAEIVNQHISLSLGFRKCPRGHRMWLPRLTVIAGLLMMSNWRTKAGRRTSIRIQMTYGQQRNFVIKINKPFDNYASP